MCKLFIQIGNQFYRKSSIKRIEFIKDIGRFPRYKINIERNRLGLFDRVIFVHSTEDSETYHAIQDFVSK